MKKIIFILAILAVLLLSGCDAMLESFYPEFADGNTITINITITDQNKIDFSYDQNIPLFVELYTSGETPEADTPFRSVELFNEFNTTNTFFVPEGSYDIWIWQDDNQDGKITGSLGEFVLAANNSTSPNIAFSGTTGKETYDASSWDTFN